MTDAIPGVDAGYVAPFVELCRTQPDRVFLSLDGVPYTFARIGAGADAFAHWLRVQGVSRGDRVAVMMRNSAQMVAMVFGLARAGAVWVPVNPQQRGAGLAYLLEHSDPRVVVVDDELRGFVDETVLPAGVRVVPASTLHADVFLPAERGEGAGFDETPPHQDEVPRVHVHVGHDGPAQGGDRDPPDAEDRRRGRDPRLPRR
ncbi:AMP-binding protein [Microbacterium sp.]|uniref:AMP-binding protein n=1 Tax=Microbacterium sp. TaxID=51671 RepID=UPI0039E40622